MCQSSPSSFFLFFLPLIQISISPILVGVHIYNFPFYISLTYLYTYIISNFYGGATYLKILLYEKKKKFICFWSWTKKLHLGKKILKTTHYLEKKVYYSNIICDTSYSCDSLHIFIFKKRFPLRKNFIIKFLSLINLISKLLMSFCLEKSRFCHANSIHILFLQDL